MPNRVTAYYTTEEPYKNVGSNHLSEIRYDESTLTLFIRFYNGAHYKYFGVEKELYEGMMLAPSHGTFFYHRIRQKYPFKLLDGEPIALNVDFEICPELKKLNDLDKQEEKLYKEFKKGLKSEQEYNQLLRVIKIKRDKLCVKLEKMDYFDTDEQEEEEIEEFETLTNTQVFEGIFQAFGIVFKTVFLMFGLFFGLLAALMR